MLLEGAGLELELYGDLLIPPARRPSLRPAIWKSRGHSLHKETEFSSYHAKEKYDTLLINWLVTELPKVQWRSKLALLRPANGSNEIAYRAA